MFILLCKQQYADHKKKRCVQGIFRLLIYNPVIHLSLKRKPNHVIFKVKKGEKCLKIRYYKRGDLKKEYNYIKEVCCCLRVDF